MNHTEIGVVQFDVVTGETERNLYTAVSGIEQLAAEGARIAVLPEMFTCSFDNENLREHCKKTPAVLEKLKETALRHGIIIAGSMPEKEGNEIYNSLFLIENTGQISGKYRKVHLFSLTNEHRFFARGDRAVVIETSSGRVGFLICYDLRFPELCRRLTDMGAEIIIVSAQWPGSRVEHWDTLLRARAIENQVFIVAANRCGRTAELEFPGHSQIISPWGDILAKADSSACVIRAVAEPDELVQARKTIPCLNERVHEAYE